MARNQLNIRLTSLVLALTMLGVSAQSQVNARIVTNDSIKISKTKLMQKCGRAGGSFRADSRGYSCSVFRQDFAGNQTETDVDCKSDGKCKGRTKTCVEIFNDLGHSRLEC